VSPFGPVQGNPRPKINFSFPEGVWRSARYQQLPHFFFDLVRRRIEGFVGPPPRLLSLTEGSPLSKLELPPPLNHGRLPPNFFFTPFSESSVVLNLRCFFFLLSPT